MKFMETNICDSKCVSLNKNQLLFCFHHDFDQIICCCTFSVGKGILQINR